MLHPGNNYEFDKLNADFDRKLDNLKEKYNRKAQDIFRAEAIGATVKHRNRVWAWFDRRTRYELKPKIMILSTLVNVILLGLLSTILFYFDCQFVSGLDLCVPWLILGLTLLGNLILLASCFSEAFSHSESQDFNPWTDPCWNSMKGNIWHRDRYDE